jgi:hypothetical protein
VAVGHAPNLGADPIHFLWQLRHNTGNFTKIGPFGASSPIIPWDAVKKRKGPDLNILPREIAKAAARDFHGLTGKPPTLSKNRHEFPHFLDAVFKALDIQSSVADHIVEAVQWWSSAHPKGEVLQHVEPIVGK